MEGGRRRSDAEMGGGARLWDAVFTGGPPGLLLRERPGVLGAAAVRSALSAAADQGIDPARLLILEGLALLWHDRWEEAHGIAQSREGERDFDLLHAILHRREGDFANASYWFRGAGNHPCYALLEKSLGASLPQGGLRAALLPGGRWSPQGFVAAVRAGGKDAAENLERVQEEEFRAFAGWLASG
jgi:hypothetical protein